MHAVILAGGFGTRLRPVVSDVPKPMAPIAEKPFLAWLIDAIARQGITGVTLSVHHDWQKIRDYFAAHPTSIPVSFAVEETPLGTGGAMAYALRSHAGLSPVLVLNGDSFVRVNYQAVLARHAEADTSLSIVLRQVENTERYGKVEVSRGVITAFGEGGTGAPGLINAGVYIMHPHLFSRYSMPEAFSFERDFIPARLAELRPQGFRADDYFIDIGIPEDYARACRELPSMLS